MYHLMYDKKTLRVLVNKCKQKLNKNEFLVFKIFRYF